MLKTSLAALVALAVAATAPAHAQAPPDMKTYASSADVQALIANARKIHKAEPTIIQPILILTPYRASLEYRTATGPAAVHEKEAEVFYIIDGSATLTTGGTLVDEKRQNATNLGGSGITGGQARTVSKGDFIVVPENTPHQFTDIKGELIQMSLHVPRG